MDEPIRNGREAMSGRFAAGHHFSRGNPASRRMGELRRALLESVTQEDLNAVFRKLTEQALAGDTQAARLVLEHAVGRPIQAVELAGPDGGPLGLDVASLTRIVLVALAGHPDAKLAVSEALGRAIDGAA